jgi:hypothetical protein
VRSSPLSPFTFLLLTASAVAQQPTAEFRPVNDFHHTSWTSEQGAPGEMYALAQTDVPPLFSSTVI